MSTTREFKIVHNVREGPGFLSGLFVRIECQTFAFAEMSKLLRCSSQKSALHHDPNCAVRLFVSLLASTVVGPNQAPVCLFSMAVDPCRIVGREPMLGTSALQQHTLVPESQCNTARVRRFCARSTRDSASACNHAFVADCCLVSLSDIDSVMLWPCCSSSNVSPAIGAGSWPKRSCREECIHHV